MARDGRILAGAGIYPDIMFPAVVTEVAALFAKVFFQLATLHLASAAANSAIRRAYRCRDSRNA